MIIDHPAIRESEEFHGFRTVHFYETECARAGRTVRRIPVFSADGVEHIALLTLCPEPCSANACDSLDIITIDEAHCLYSGATRHDGSDLEAVLSRAGFHLGSSAAFLPAPQTAPSTESYDDLVQLSLFA